MSGIKLGANFCMTILPESSGVIFLVPSRWGSDYTVSSAIPCSLKGLSSCLYPGGQAQQSSGCLVMPVPESLGNTLLTWGSDSEYCSLLGEDVIIMHLCEFMSENSVGWPRAVIYKKIKSQSNKDTTEKNSLLY